MIRFTTAGRMAVACVLLPSATFAAEHHGRVFFGNVPVPGAVVTVTRDGKSISTVTDSQGLYQFPDIAEGAWKLRVEMQGFAPFNGDLNVTRETTMARWDLKLLTLQQLLALSTERRIAAPALLLPRPAAKPDTTKKADTDAGPPPPPPPDDNAVKSADGLLINGSESNAATSKYSMAPAFGNRRAGAKGLYNGSMGAFANNAVFDARPYSLTGLQVPRADYSHMTVVATLGGPLRIPHILWHGPNFFIGYQWTRDRDASTLSGLVPTVAQRAGDLSSSGIPIYNPGTTTPITGLIPVSTQAAALLALYPLPNFAGNTGYNYQAQIINNTHTDSLQSRLDKGFGKRDQVYGGFSFRSVRGDAANLFGFRDVTNTLGIDTNVHWSHRLPHRILVDTGFRFTRLRTEVRPYFAGRANISGDAGITGNAQDPNNWGPPTLQFSSGISSLSDGISTFNRNRTGALSVEATWTHGRQTTTFGGDFRRQEYNQLQQQNPRGNFTFNGLATGGSDLADFLLGVPDTSAIAFGNADKYLRQSVVDGFVNDDWRIKPELTITAGLRWDYGAPLTELKNRLVNIDLAPGFGAALPVQASSPVGPVTGMHYPTSLVNGDHTKWQPRVGIALRPDPTSTMVIRAGYGIYVDTTAYLAAVQQMAQQFPLSKSFSVANSSTCPLSLANGFGCSSAATFALDPNFRVGTAQTWSVTVQRDLPLSMVATVGYNGTKGLNGPQEILPNTYPIGATTPCPACPVGFVYRTSNGNSIRNAGTLQLRRRLRSGLAAQLDYTYAHSIDNDSELGGQGHVVGSSSSSTTTTATATSSPAIAQNWLDLRAERSSSSFDQRHLLKLQMQYTSGMGMKGGTLLTGWRGKVLKDWTISGQMSLGTGLPQTPVYLATVPGTGFTGTIRPSRTGADIYATTDPGHHLNASAYTAPAAGQWGNAGRNSITGPGQFTLDTTLARTFRLGDRFNLETGLDATNLLNHPVYTQWNNIISPISSTCSVSLTCSQVNKTFGLPAGTQAMRSLQIHGRLRF